MSSASFGSPSARPRHHPNASSPNTPAVLGGIGSPNHALQTRNDGGGGNNNRHASPSVAFQRHHNLSHEAPSPQQRAVPPRHTEVIELNDSDSEGGVPGNIYLGKRTPRSAHLQPPFDPISRSVVNNNTSPTSTAAVAGSSKPGHRASASPSIASLINADPPAKKPRTSGVQPTSSFVEESNGNNSSTSNSSNYKRHKKEPTEGSPMLKAATAIANNNNNSNNTNNNNSNSNNNNNSNSTANSSKAPSPKPGRQAGSSGGLLGSVLPGMGGGNQEDDFRPPNIYINFPLGGETNRYIDFAKLTEEKYGWAALNPRLAKAKMNMDSGDEMLVDGSESESNVEMGGVGEASESSKQRKKRRYQDIYDKEDPFIDDSEMMWEEQAASSKDGFFVYSGPLVPQGEKPLIERADGTVKRGRGRGRGRGGTTTTRAPTTTTRKPRITKKEKEKLEKEREERERLALAASQSKEVHPH